MKETLMNFLRTSPTAYQACENAAELLEAHGFTKLSETDDWSICEGGKYYVVRGGSSLVAFTVGSLDDFSYKIAAAHTDSPALKLKENPVKQSGVCATLNVEKYGGGILYSYFDRPLHIAGRVVRRTGSILRSENVVSPFLVTIPSLAIHQNRNVNDGFPISVQVDLSPLCALSGESFNADSILKKIVGENAVSYDLFLANADMPYTLGVDNEFLASPRIDNLTSVSASLQALLSSAESSGICVAACLDNEEVGSLSAQGADGDFLENVLRRIAYALRFDDNEYYKALASSFLLSIDNAHAIHPNHPEKSDSTNKTVLGGGIVIKHHAGKAYVTDAVSSAIAKTIFDNAGVAHQSFFNHSDAKSGATLGSAILRHASMPGADIGLAQLAMHSACECIAWKDYESLISGLSAYFATTLRFTENGICVE